MKIKINKAKNPQETKITNIKKIFKQYELTVHIIKNGTTRMKVTLIQGSEEVFFKIIKAYFQNDCEFINAKNYILKFDNVKKD